MRKFVVLTTLISTYFLFGYWLSSISVEVTTNPFQGSTRPSYFFDYRGSIHSHSNLSSGSGSPEDIIDEASQAGLDFLLLTDMNIFNHAWSLNGYHNELLVGIMGEYDYLESRLLLFNRDQDQNFETMGSVQTAFTDYLSQDPSPEHFLVLSHPNLPGYKWQSEIPAGLTGMEIYNFKSLWQAATQKSKFSILWSLFIYPFNSDIAILRLFEFPRTEVEKWDQILQTRQFHGFLGHDATAKVVPFAGNYLKLPSYKTLFSFASNHILLRSELTGNSFTDRSKLMTALFNGHFYMSLDILGNPKGFYAEIRQDGRRFLFGDTLKIDDQTILQIQLPLEIRSQTTISLYKDGSLYRETKSKSLQEAIKEPGNYRIIVWADVQLPFPDHHKKVPWITTNVFKVLPADL